MRSQRCAAVGGRVGNGQRGSPRSTAQSGLPLHARQLSGLRTASSPVTRPSSTRTAMTPSISPLSRRISAGYPLTCAGCMAAPGLVLLMVGAVITRIRRHEARFMLGDLVYLALAGFVAWGRLGPEPFTG
jgi:hypothetical protein